MNPITITIDHLLGKPNPKVIWLSKVAEQLRRERINRDGGKANNLPPINHGL